MDELRFDGRVAVLTGAGRGVGRGQAIELARRGAAVVVNDVGFEELEGGTRAQGVAQAVVDEIVAAGGRAVANSDDAGAPGTGPRLIEQAMDEFGGVDIVVANAGTSKHVSFADMSFDDFEFTLHTHLYSAFHVVKAAWPHFQRNRYGRVVMTISGVGMFGMPNSITYGTAKAGIYGLMRGLSIEGEEHGIKVNAFWPTAFTRMIRGTEDLVKRVSASMPIEGAIPAAIWLAHESCSVTGETLHGGSSRVSRVVVAETLGVHKPGFSPEDVAGNLEAIVDPTTQYAYRVASDSNKLQSEITTNT